MHDLLAPIVAVGLATIALLGSAVFGYRIGRAVARSRSRRILAEAVALRGSAGRELLAALNHRANVESTMGVAYVAGWRPPVIAEAVDPLPSGDAPLHAIPRDRSDTLRCGAPPPLSAWPDLPDVPRDAMTADPFAELDEPDSHVRRTMLPPPMPRYEGVEPKTPKEPRS